MLPNQNFHKFFKKRKFVAKNSKICPKNTCLLPSKIGLGMWKMRKEKPKWRIITTYHLANFLAKFVEKKKSFYYFIYIYIYYFILFFLEISSLSKTLPCRPGISEMTIYTNW
jgi:hypothetical protein